MWQGGGDGCKWERIDCISTRVEDKGGVPDKEGEGAMSLSGRLVGHHMVEVVQFRGNSMGTPYRQWQERWSSQVEGTPKCKEMKGLGLRCKRPCLYS